MKKQSSELLQKCVESVKVRATAAFGEDALDKITIERATLGLFFSGVKISTGHGGLCFTPIKEMPAAVCCPTSAKAMPYAGKMAGTPIRGFLEDIFDSNPLKCALGISTLNALSIAVLEAEGKLPGGPSSCMSYGDAFDEVDVNNYNHAVVVGAMVPIMRQLRQSNCNWHVLEMDSRTLKAAEMEHFVPADQAATVVPDADLLVITGVTMLNDTLAGLLELAKQTLLSS